MFYANITAMKRLFRQLKIKLKENLAVKSSKKILSSYLKKDFSKKILLVSHQLTTTGSPLMLYHLAKTLKEQGFSPLVVSYKGGSLTNAFRKLGIDIILGEVFQYDSNAFKRIAKHFDKILANSIVCYSAIESYNDAIWWIHESQYIETSFMKDFPTLEDTLRKAKKIFVVSDYAKETVKKYNPNVEITLLGVEDHFDKNFKKSDNDKIKFALVGNICECRAQDILVKAMSKIDDEVLKKSEFHFFCEKKGRRYRKIVKDTKKYDNIIFDGLINNQNEKWKVFSNMDVFIIPSRDESCSLVALEACMLKKPIIISENVGANYMLKEEQNGYIVKTEDPKDLADAIKKIIDNKDDLEKMGEISRLLYEEKASIEMFKKELQKIIDACRETL